MNRFARGSRAFQGWTTVAVAVAITASIALCSRAEANADQSGDSIASRESGSDLWGVYSQGGWATLHRGPANRKLVGSVPLAEHYSIWSVLEGAAVLTAPTISPDGKTLYVTTGRAAGASNLHAFSLDGGLRWQSEPWSSTQEGVDPCAILSSPIVDQAGDIYIGDCNQLFAYRPDGRVKWVAPLPSPREGDWKPSEVLEVNALTTAVFTREGHVLGVTNFGDVVIFDRETGTRLEEPMRLPGHVPGASTVMPMPESIFGNGLVDPEIRSWAWQLLVGGAMPSANTPAVDLATGRIFVAATSTTEGRGALYGLDLTRGDRPGTIRVEIAFGTEMGPGSGSSPSLSPSAHRAYVSDEEGLFYSVDARSGEIAWKVQTRATAAAAAVGAGGDIYALQANGPAIVAIEESGRVRWESDLAELAAEALPSGFFLGDPVATGNGNPTYIDGFVLVPVIYGYETSVGRSIPWPVRSSVVALDAATGKGVRNVVELIDDSTGITGVLPDGTLTNTLGTALTSGVTPLAGLARWLLPGDLEPLLAKGGLQVSRPLVAERVVVDKTAAHAAMAERLAARSEADREQDASRRPLDVLALAGIDEGMHVLDLMSGGGWYAEVLARAVGQGGQVVAHNNRISGERYGEALAERLEGSELANVERLAGELDALEFPAGDAARFDAVFLVQFYHDTVWMGVDRAEMNARIFDALAPGGRFLVIDHRAEQGSGIRDAERLHRIDEAVVVKEIEAAGFVLTQRSGLLANPADDRARSVFDPRIRGETDRMLLRFVKPDGLGSNASAK